MRPSLDEGLEPEPDAQAPDLDQEEDLAGSARRGIVLTGGSTVSRTAVELLTSILLARLLAPEEFGIVAVAATFLGLSFIIGNLGVGIAVVQAKRLEPSDRNTAFFLASGVGLLFTTALSAISPFAANFFQMPVLKAAMPIMALQILLSGASATPIALLRRRLQFGRSAAVDMTGSASYGVTSVGLALAGYGVWSLVWAPVVAGAAVLGLALLLSRFLPTFRVSREAARRFLHYGGTLTVKNIFVHISRHADKFIIAKLLGAHATGIYARAFNWSAIPDMRLMPVLQTVSFPVLCRLRDRRERFNEWFVKVTALGAVAMVPLSLGLIVLADDFTMALFGEQWRGIVVSLRILSFAGLLNSMNRLAGAAIEATGKLRYEVATQALYAALLPLGALLAIPYGIEGVGWSVLGATVVLYVSKGVTLYSALGLHFARYLKALLPSLSAGLIMAVAVYGVLTYSDVPSPATSGREHWLRLVAGAVVGAIVYPLALRLLARQHFQLLTGQLARLLDKTWKNLTPHQRQEPTTVVIQEPAPHAESIMRALYNAYARRLRVIYVHADPGKWSMREALRGHGFGSLGLERPGLHTVRVSPPIPWSRLGKIASLNRWLYLRSLLRYIAKHIDPSVVLLTQYPFLLPSFRGLRALRVYYVMDDYVGLQLDERSARRVERAHRRALRQSDAVWATAGVIVDAIRELRPDVEPITNGVDFKLFSGATLGAVPEVLAGIGRPRVGMIGRLNDRVDWQLIEEVCLARIDWNVIAIGPLYGPMKVTPDRVARLKERANFHHVPAVPEDAMPAYIAGLDVCLIPYIPAGSNLSVNPLKLYQYLAVGKPVVASQIPALKAFTDVVELAGDAESFIAAIERSLETASDGDFVRRRRERAQEFDWQVIADSQIMLLRERSRSLHAAPLRSWA